jgi:TPR repeat protein
MFSSSSKSQPILKSKALISSWKHSPKIQKSIKLINESLSKYQINISKPPKEIEDYFHFQEAMKLFKMSSSKSLNEGHWRVSALFLYFRLISLQTFAYAQKAGDKNSIDGSYWFAWCLRSFCQYGKAFNLFQIVSQFDHSGALFCAGRCLIYGNGTKINIQEGKKLMVHSAEFGNSVWTKYVAFVIENGIWCFRKDRNEVRRLSQLYDPKRELKSIILKMNLSNLFSKFILLKFILIHKFQFQTKP